MMLTRRPDPSLPTVLFCFAHASGSAASFRTWLAPGAALGIEVAPIELPGHGRRLLEEPFRRLDPLVDALVPLIEAHGNGRRVAYLGHSLGALVAHALAERLEPDHLFVSAARAPGQALRTAELQFPLADVGQRELLAQLGGTPQEVLDDAEMMDLLLPPLAADLEVLEDAASRPSAPVDCPIRTYGGKDDPLVRTEELAQWEPFTRAQFSTRRFPGDHFYLAVLASELLTDICSHLRTTPTFR